MATDVLPHAGLVIGNHYRVDRIACMFSQVAADGSLMPQIAPPTSVTELRYSVVETLLRGLLYYDSIEFPLIAGSNQTLTEGQFFWILRERNILRRPVVEIPGPTITNISWAQSSATRYIFEERERAQPGCWVIAPLIDPVPLTWGEAVDPKQAALVECRGVEFELTDRLPVPLLRNAEELANAITFKEKHSALLRDLRIHINGLYGEIVNSQDLTYEKTSKFRELDRALDELDNSLTGSHIQMFRDCLRMDVITEDMAENMAAAGEVAEEIVPGGSSVVAPVTAAITAAGNVFSAYRTKLKTPVTRPGPLAYLSKARAQGVIQDAGRRGSLG